MRKSLTALSLVAAFFAGQAMADHATLDALQAAGVALSEEQAEYVIASTCENLIDFFALLATDNPEKVLEIEKVAIQACPGFADEISNSIKAAVNGVGSDSGHLSGSSVTIPTNSIPSIGGAGGGGNTVASPN